MERKTAHYDLYLEGADADAVADLVEGEYAVLAQFFGREPNGCLTLKVFSSHERYVATINALSPSRAGSARDMMSGGRYNPESKAAYAAQSRGPYSTRETILHECVHQFHFLAVCDNETPKSQYYAEGLAEHFAVHEWNGRHAVLGKVPLIAARDDPAQALSDLRTQHRGGPRQLATSAERLGLDPRGLAYGAGWGLVSFLIDRRPEQFRHWAAELDAQAEPAAAWDHVFRGESDDALTKEYEAWLLAHQEPWRVISGDWQNTDEHTFQCATSTPKGAEFAVLKAPAATLRGSVSVDGDQAGVVVGYKSNDSYDVLFVSATGAPVHHKLREGKWTSKAATVDDASCEPEEVFV